MYIGDVLKGWKICDGIEVFWVEIDIVWRKILKLVNLIVFWVNKKFFGLRVMLFCL